MGPWRGARDADGRPSGPGEITFHRAWVALNPYSQGTINKATMLMILINGLTAGPAVSL